MRRAGLQPDSQGALQYGRTLNLGNVLDSCTHWAVQVLLRLELSNVLDTSTHWSVQVALRLNSALPPTPRSSAPPLSPLSRPILTLTPTLALTLTLPSVRAPPSQAQATS